MNKKIVLFSFVVFFTTLCAFFYGYRGEIQSSSESIAKNNLSQKYDHHNSDQGYTLSDNQEEPDLDDIEKVKFDYSVIVQQWISLFFGTDFHETESLAIHDPVFTTTPRYILYHSLQIDFC
ncbi:hypothetical protein [Chryseobacterium paridis]|uniref:Uncharacterized protein n=1 Tax=Chryseobacterium paridis TaxID=2800328 RepID=A0ABS1FYC3_9FLAO|nr:hypothetical protein [Chryseobacterium paridis]MBK1897404.1 hypothetical protein [Chryseobacterium paridis]